MSNLNIQTINSTLVVDSRLVAAELGIEHDSLKKNIKVYRSDFEELGNLPTDSRGVLGTSSYAECFYLNEDQCYLALTYSNNTNRVRVAKINLIKAFKVAREKAAQLQQPDILYLLEQSAAAIREARALAAQAEAKVVELAPKVEIYNTVCEQGRNLKIGAVAKILSVENMGPNRLFAFLRDKEVLMKNNEPYAKYEFESKYFTCIRGTKNNHDYITPLVTPEGIEFIIKLLTKHGYYVPSKVAA